MNLRELEAAYLVHLYGSYHEAAKDAGVHISVLSKRVAALEEELGLKLFTRDTRKGGTALTPCGETILPMIRRMLNAHAAMQNRAKAYLKEEPDRITVGITLMLGDLGSGKLLSEFCIQNPTAQITTILRSQGELMRLLSEGRLDCAFFHITEQTAAADYWRTMLDSSSNGEQMEIIPLAETDDMYIGISRRDALARQDEVTLRDLRYHCLLFNRWAEDALDGRSGFFAKLGEDAADYEVMVEDFLNRGYIYRIVAAGLGVLPQVFPESAPVPDVKFLRLKGWSKRSRIVFVARRYGGQTLDRFTQFVRAQAAVKTEREVEQ